MILLAALGGLLAGCGGAAASSPPPPTIPCPPVPPGHPGPPCKGGTIAVSVPPNGPVTGTYLTEAKAEAEALVVQGQPISLYRML
jgi:hypothetical protein